MWTVLLSALCSHSQRLWLGFLGAAGLVAANLGWMDQSASYSCRNRPTATHSHTVLFIHEVLHPFPALSTDTPCPPAGRPCPAAVGL